jgi:hypothetical protein
VGIFGQKGTPVAHAPSELIVDPSYMPSAQEASPVKHSVGQCEIPGVIPIHLDAPAACPAPGTKVFVFAQGGNGPVAWADGLKPRRLGAVAPTHQQDVTTACRAIGSGLPGIVLGQPGNTDVVFVRVVGGT